MKLNSAQQEPILTNVATTGEFRIRNSAKAFSILSSGLYANKIRAIIRELSCNAVDSHVAARVSKPFEVHLPSAVEPWFSVQDYGTGLTHEQVINIYTTYFESTKTDSNDYIGALGLGSKSPFSYTDNFTVTAVRDGIKNIYSAFIADNGVPSVSLMATQSGDFPNGVEVKFPVVKEGDYSSFFKEAREVFTYFAVRPVITGRSDWTFQDVEYKERDIAPGIHLYTGTDNYGHRARAVMGNICYPLYIPNAEIALGPQAEALLRCPLEIHFPLGALDIQASREGLSYIPETVAAIKTRLDELLALAKGHLVKRIAEFTNHWDLVKYLYEQVANPLFRDAVISWCRSNKPPLFNDPFPPASSARLFNNIELRVTDLVRDYNIKISSLITGHSSRRGVQLVKLDTAWDGTTQTAHKVLRIDLNNSVKFVTSDIRGGAGRRVRDHFARRWVKHREQNIVIILEPADRSQPADYNGLLKSLYDPRDVQLVSSLDPVERKKVNNGVRVGLFEAVLETDRERNRRGNWWTWLEIDDASSITDTIYYVPMKNKTAETVKYGDRLFELVRLMRGSGIDKLKKARVFGVRKHQLAEIKNLPNFRPLEEFVDQVMSQVTDQDVERMAAAGFVRSNNLTYLTTVAALLPDVSPFKVMVQNINSAKTANRGEDFDPQSFNTLCQNHRKGLTLDDAKQALDEKFKTVLHRYPLINHIEMGTYNRTPAVAVAQYINLIDQYGDK